MTFRKISPLGPRAGTGTFDCLFDTKYNTLEEAKAANDYVQIDFVVGEDECIYFEMFNTKSPEVKKHMRLNYQHFPCGVDVMDDGLACEMATTMF